MTNRKGSSVIILVFSLFSLLGLAAFALDLGLILNQRYEMQKAVETAALIAASEYEPFENGVNYTKPGDTQITDSGTGNAALHYLALINTNQVTTGIVATPTVSLNTQSRAVMVEANPTLQTYFLQALGVTGVSIPAKAAAVNVPVYLSGRFPMPTGSILKGDSTGTGGYLDTDIKQPLGSAAGNTTTVHNRNVNFNNIYGQPDGRVLSLGPGGYITIKLPAPLVDGKGVDFAIYERGHAEGYFVYAGIDVDDTDTDGDAPAPYIDASNPGDGIKWVNISCTGIPLYVNKNELIGCHQTQVTIGGGVATEYKFYGSGYFDLGSKCTSGGVDIYDSTATNAGEPRLGNVKYIKIIDDNREDGFLIQSKFGIATPSAIPMLIPGEHSTFSPGADIDAVEIFHHSRLISIADYSADGDGDGLIDILEDIYGFNDGNADTDSDGISDLAEFWGYNVSSGSSLNAADTDILYKDYPDWGEVPPVFEIVP